MVFNNHFGNYVCECGKEFLNSQSFNGHKASCKIHMQAKYGEDFDFDALNVTRKIKSDESRSVNAILRKEEELNQWLSEKHTCEHCGKIMAEKFGTGRFCCRKCANTRKHSEETKKKISDSMFSYAKSDDINTSTNRSAQLQAQYFTNPGYCVICNKLLPYSKRTNIFCSVECQTVYYAEHKGEQLHFNYKYGTYKGYECDSSWELAFVMYCLDHNTKIERCKEFFRYIIDNKEHLYFPDFIVDNKYYEIKSFYTDTVNAKIEQFPKDKTLIIIDKQKINPYLQYAKKTYGDYFYGLYDLDKPNWFLQYIID